jgi:hypothetical protein
MPITFILTNAGKAAIVAANNTGTNPVTVNRIGVGSASWTPTATATALQTEIKKINAVGGTAVADDTIHVTASDNSSDVYTVREIGLFLTDGTLLAVYSQAAAIITKGADTVALIAADLVITGVPAGSVTVGDTTFDYPQATETVKGVAEIATDAEVSAGTDTERIVTPARLAQRYVRKAGDTMTGALTAPGFVGPLNGNASSSSQLQTPRSITLGGDLSGSVSFNGSQNVTIAATMVSASATVAGKVELATNAETQTGTDSERAVTPAGLTARTSTDTRTGIVELATSAETQAGTDTERAVTPAGLASRTATATRTGLIELATQAETNTGTDTERAVTPQTLRLFPGSARAWVNFNGIGTVAINASHGVTSITDLAVGFYQINWAAGVFSSSNYAWAGCARLDVNATDHIVISAIPSQTKTSSHLQIRTSLDEGVARDSPEISVVAFA